jgi:hypothetical protein
MQAEPLYSVPNPGVLANFNTWEYWDAYDAVRPLRWVAYEAVGGFESPDLPYEAPLLQDYISGAAMNYMTAAHGLKQFATREYGSLKVVSIDFRVGYGSTWANFISYVDDVKINAMLVNFEPTSPSGGTATGTGIVTFSTNNSFLVNLVAVSESSLPQAGKPTQAFPHGFFSFDITGIAPGDTVIVTITLPTTMPMGTQYWKYQVPAGWIDATPLLGDNDGDNVLTLTLTDGGLGDADGIANGIIVEPGGPGIPPVGGYIAETAVNNMSGNEIAILATCLTLLVVAIASVMAVKRKRRT